jgi:hypothetical protein
LPLYITQAAKVDQIFKSYVYLFCFVLLGSSAHNCGSNSHQLNNKYCGSYLGYNTAGNINAPVCGMPVLRNRHFRFFKKLFDARSFYWIFLSWLPIAFPFCAFAGNVCFYHEIKQLTQFFVHYEFIIFNVLSSQRPMYMYMKELLIAKIPLKLDQLCLKMIH